MQTLLINLQRRPDRLDNMASQLNALGIPFQRVDAIDARSTSDEELAAQFNDSGPLGVIPQGDKCCTLSHVRAWQTFVESGHSHGLFLEDDVAIDANAAHLLRQTDWIPSNVDLLKLERFGPASQLVLVDESVKVVGGHKIRRLRSRHTGAAAYVMSRRAALNALNQKGPWPLPVDHLLFNPNNSQLANLLKAYQLTPAIARQSAALGGRSDIVEWRAIYRRLGWSYFRRELVRAYYEIRMTPDQILRLLRGESVFVRVDDPVEG